jgi:hypothetical protein
MVQRSGILQMYNKEYMKQSPACWFWFQIYLFSIRLTVMASDLAGKFACGHRVDNAHACIGEPFLALWQGCRVSFWQNI